MYNPFEENPPKNKFKGFNPFAPKPQEDGYSGDYNHVEALFNEWLTGEKREPAPWELPRDKAQENAQNSGWFPPLKPTIGVESPTGEYKDYSTASEQGQQKPNFWEMLGNNPYLMSGAETGLNSSTYMTGLALGSGNKGLAAIGGGKTLLNLARTGLSGYAAGKSQRDVMGEYYKNIRRGQEGYYQFIGENGGTIPLFKNGGFLDLAPEKLATGEYEAGLPKAMQHLANAETEEKEWLITPNQEVKKITGEKHENGGVKQFLQPGTKIVSDNLKIGKDVSDVVKDRLGVKLKPNQTYASAIDTYTKSIGLADLTKELEDIHKQLKNNSSFKDEQTQKINEKFLSKKLEELENKRAPLLEKRLMFSETLFAAQELAKETPMYRNGGTHLDPNIAALMRKHNIPLDQGAQILRYMQEGGEMNPQMIQQMMMQGQEQQGQAMIMVNPQTGETVEITSQEEYEAYTQQGYVTMEEFQMMQQQGMEGEEVMMEDGGEMEQLMTGVIDMLMQGAQPEEVLQELLQMGMDEQTATQVIQQAAQMASQGGQPQQEEMMMNGGEKKYVPSYNNGGEKPTWGAGSPESIAKLKEYLKHYGLEKELKELEKNSDKTTLNRIAGKLQTTIIKKNPELVVDYMLNVADPNNRLISMGYKTRDELKKALEKGDVTKEKIKEAFNDEMWWYRAPIDEVKTLSPEKYKAKMEELKDKGISQGDYKFEYDKDTGKYIRYESDDNVVDGAVDDGKKAADNSQSKINPLRIESEPIPRMYSPVPMPFNLPPSALQAHFKKRITPYDEEEVRIDPNIQPFIDAQAPVIAALQDSPAGIGLAGYANMSGLTLGAISKYLAETDKANLMNAQAVEGKNVERWGRADIINQKYMEDYERNSLTALAKTQNDIYNYFNAQDSNRLKKHQYMTNRALIEGLFDNVYYDPSTGQMKSTTRGAKFDV